MDKMWSTQLKNGPQGTSCLLTAFFQDMLQIGFMYILRTMNELFTGNVIGMQVFPSKIPP